MTPSEVLGRAADLIRDTAAEASSGQWSAVDLSSRGLGMRGWQIEHPASDGDGTFTVASVTSLRAEADARWIALLSPAVAPAIERILRDAAKSFDVESKIWKPEVMVKKLNERRYAGPMALARVILGEEVTEDDRT